MVKKKSAFDTLQWASRWEDYEGESRTLLLRQIAIGLFYLIDLLNYCGLHFGSWVWPAVVDANFHAKMTMLCVAWSLSTAMILICLRRGLWPGGMKYLATGWDLVLLTIILGIADGTRSPLVVGYFLIVVLASLRFSLPLIRFATLASMACYVVVARTAVQNPTPLYSEVIFLVALGFSGLLCGQIVRRAHVMLADWSDRS